MKKQIWLLALATSQILATTIDVDLTDASLRSAINTINGAPGTYDLVFLLSHR